METSDLTLAAMGTMGNMGGQGGDRGGFERSKMDFSNFGGRSGNDSVFATPTGGAETGMPGFEKPTAPTDELEDSHSSARQQATVQTTTNPTEEPSKTDERVRPSFIAGFESSGMNRQSSTHEAWIWIVVCAALLCAA